MQPLLSRIALFVGSHVLFVAVVVQAYSIF
jgi:hypothetical protein